MTQRANAALYYVASGYSTSGPQLMGINAASEGFLRAMVDYADVETLFAVSEEAGAETEFRQAVTKFRPGQATDFISISELEKLDSIGTLFLPGPGLGDYAWMRRRLGGHRFSLCGVAHTTATPLVLDAITTLQIAPVEPWDAVVCPSQSVKAMIEHLLDDHHLYLKERFGQIDAPAPRLPVIPLGIEIDDFRPDPRSRAIWRAAWNIADGDVAVLHVGRLTPSGKAHPVPLFMAMAAASQRTSSLHLIMAGWFINPDTEAAYHDAAAQICPEVNVIFVDARSPDVRAGVWRAADIFISPVDNIQETFGLTPVEAMAAGLPVIVSAWNGYRETVRHGVDGFLIPTIALPAGVGSDLEIAYGARTIDYGAYIGVSSQSVTVDIAAMTEAIVTLASDHELRRRMGEQGRGNAESFAWRAIIPRYQALWTELAALRASADRPLPSKASSYPARPEPFTIFAGYPDDALRLDATVGVGPVAPGVIDYLLDSPLAAFMTNALPPRDLLKRVIRTVEAQPGTVSALLQLMGGADLPHAWRAVAWLLKYDLIRLARTPAPHQTGSASSS